MLAFVGGRMVWHEVPDRVRDEVAAWFGAAVLEEESQPGGFSPGVASRLLLADGRRVFVKAVGSARNPDAPHIHRREAEVMAYLPASAPTPRLLQSFDDGDWVVLVIEDVEGTPPRLPWQPDELARVLTALEQMATSLTPAPAVAPVLFDQLKDEFTGWRSLRSLLRGGGVAELDSWALDHLDELVALEECWPEAARGNTLLHADLRDDNLLLTEDGGVVAVDAVLAALTGYFLFHATWPAPQNMPTLRAFQRAQGEAALAWLRARTARNAQNGGRLNDDLRRH
jgi:aminoglycoside phosphotransferase (APT) family kinase protein